MELLPHVSLAESLDDTDLPSLDFDAVSSFVDAALKEKLTLSRKATALVASVVHPHLQMNGYEFARCDVSHHTRARLQRLELPALFTDHELDVASFKQGSLERIKIDLPLEKVNEENDEGLGFSEAFWASADEGLGKAKSRGVLSEWSGRVQE
ncbi:hypothetical protein KEM55_002648 [Ascosphaera atra]|nr:hypothetical protein KEM55_002648 [Ascosphaera atra]